MSDVARPLHDPDGRSLAAVVLRARAEAQAAGELLDAAVAPVESHVPLEALPLIRAWLRDGGYAAAVAQVVADDPELATQ